ncbi:PfkB family carbohydrate kinase [Lachnospiraceae bacterium JLR.KK008]
MRLIALGDNSIDFYRNTGERYPGGNAVNVAVHAAHMGADAHYLGTLGTDEAAKMICRAMGRHDVDYSRCRLLDGKTTKVCIYDVLDGERTFVEVMTGETWVGPIRLTADEYAYLESADAIVTSCNAKIPEQLAAVEELSPVFVFDFGEKEKYRTEEYYDQICHQMDLAMFSCSEMTDEAFAQMCRPLHDRGVVHVLATVGAKGQLLSDGDIILHGTVDEVTPNDTMGAGDSFLAAFVCALLNKGWKKGRRMEADALQCALKAGAETAARNCMTKGAFLYE